MNLTPREREILQHMCNGLIGKRLARKLGIAPRTVIKHRENIGQKTGCTSSVQLGVWAARQGIV